MSRTPPEVSLPPGEIRSPDDHRRLKAQLHHQLVAGMDLSVVGTMTKEQLQQAQTYRLTNTYTGAGTSTSPVHGGHLGSGR